jgi:hypothetical protein
MNALSSYTPLQQFALTRFGRLKMMQRDVLPHLDGSDYRVRLTLKALYSAYEDLRELGLEEEARLLLERGSEPQEQPAARDEQPSEAE